MPRLSGHFFSQIFSLPGEACQAYNNKKEANPIITGKASFF